MQIIRREKGWTDASLISSFEYHLKELELTRWVFENEGAQFMSGVQHASVPAGLAGVSYGLLFGVDVLQKEDYRTLTEM